MIGAAGEQPSAYGEVAVMRGQILLLGAIPFVMAFLGTSLAVALVAPGMVGAQAARVPEQGSVIVSPDGTERVRMGTGPGYFANVRVLAPDGITPRAELATGGNPALGSTNPQGAGVNLFALDGTRIGRLGTRGSDAGNASNLILSDAQGRDRLVAALEADGTPWIRFYDADGNVTWSAP